MSSQKRGTADIASVVRLNRSAQFISRCDDSGFGMSMTLLRLLAVAARNTSSKFSSFATSILSAPNSASARDCARSDVFEPFAERRTNDLNDGLAVGGFASRSALTGSCSKCAGWRRATDRPNASRSASPRQNCRGSYWAGRNSDLQVGTTRGLSRGLRAWMTVQAKMARRSQLSPSAALGQLIFPHRLASMIAMHRRKAALSFAVDFIVRALRRPSNRVAARFAVPYRRSSSAAIVSWSSASGLI